MRGRCRVLEEHQPLGTNEKENDVGKCTQYCALWVNEDAIFKAIKEKVNLLLRGQGERILSKVPGFGDGFGT